MDLNATTRAGRASVASHFRPLLSDGRSLADVLVENDPKFIHLQLFASGTDDDDLGAPPEIDVSSLSDDPATLKRTIGTLLADNRKVRREAGNRRSALRTAEQQLNDEKAAHTKTKGDLEGERDKIKGDLETANRSNGQLRSKFREQFVDQHVRTELEKRGAKNVDDAMKLLDVSKIEFDEEKLGVKDAAALTATLDEFAKTRDYLFGATQNDGNRGIRGTSFGRGASDTPAGGGGGKEIPKDASPEEAFAQILGI